MNNDVVLNLVLITTAILKIYAYLLRVDNRIIPDVDAVAHIASTCHFDTITHIQAIILTGVNNDVVVDFVAAIALDVDTGAATVFNEIVVYITDTATVIHNTAFLVLFSLAAIPQDLIMVNFTILNG